MGESDSPDREPLGPGVAAGPGLTELHARGRRPLVSWPHPTRGYVACAVTMAGLGASAVLAWQVWLLAWDESVRWGWSGTSVACALAAAVITVELARRPRPSAYRPQAGRPEFRAVDTRERQLVRRAVRTAVPPAERRLALIAAQQLTARAGQWYLPTVYLFGASVFAGLAATSSDAAYPSGVVWAFGGPLILAVALWARRQLRRLEQAWQDGRRLP